MEMLAVTTPAFELLGGLEGCRRTTGVLRAHVALSGLIPLVHPLDADELLLARELARWRPCSTVIRVGYYERRVPCRLELDRWRGDRAVLALRALEPLPVSEWWVDARTFAGLPATPSTLLA